MIVDSPLRQPVMCGCLNLRRRRKNVRFNNAITTPYKSRKSFARKGTRVVSSARSVSSRRSFYSCLSNLDTSCGTSETGDFAMVSCTCSFPAHSEFNPEFPLVCPPDTVPGSTEEMLVHAKAIQGRWVTIMSRSQSLDAQMAHVGVNKMKRMVMNRLAIPFHCELQDNSTILKCWLITPAGNKYTTASLVGEETFDADGDLGDWSGRTEMIDWSWSLFCNGKTFRAMRLTRNNPKLGVAHETRAVLPDTEEGKILYYNMTVIPPAPGAKTIVVDRIYRFEASLDS